MNATESETNGTTSVWSNVVTTSIGVLGSIILLGNLTIMSLIVLLLIKKRARKESFCFLVHLLSVCINDTLCGLMLFTMAVINVDGEGIARFCAYVLFSALTLQSASQGNICCVSAQRYVFSRNIRQNSLTWQMFHTKTLLIVNILIASGTFISYAVGVRLRTGPYVEDDCYFSNVLDQDVTKHITSYFLLGISFTVVSDILCFLSIRKLSAGKNGTVRPEVSKDKSISSCADSTVVLQTTKARQRSAIVTIMLIIIFFNMSVLPSFIGFVLSSAEVDFSAQLKRVLMMSMFINSLINPVIIATRVKDIRSSIRGIFTHMRSYVVNGR